MPREVVTCFIFYCRPYLLMRDGSRASTAPATHPEVEVGIARWQTRRVGSIRMTFLALSQFRLASVRDLGKTLSDSRRVTNPA